MTFQDTTNFLRRPTGSSVCWAPSQSGSSHRRVCAVKRAEGDEAPHAAVGGKRKVRGGGPAATEVVLGGGSRGKASLTCLARSRRRPEQASPPHGGDGRRSATRSRRGHNLIKHRAKETPRQVARRIPAELDGGWHGHSATRCVRSASRSEGDPDFTRDQCAQRIAINPQGPPRQGVRAEQLLEISGGVQPPR
jgi:hypothetical protein